MTQPLILTLKLDPSSQEQYEALRQQYFPAARNLVPVHLSLFHQLPDEEHSYQSISEIAQATVSFHLTHGSPRSIGHGVAVFFESAELTSLHAILSMAFSDSLIPQDRQRFRPHIVIQNKVDAETARQTLSQLQNVVFADPNAIGLTLWRYLGGPWEWLQDFRFSES